VFSTGIIISDTDYRIFVAYKGVTGLDLAYFRNSYVYHTTLDTVASIEEGSIQHMGDNILAVLKEMGSTPVLDVSNNSKMLYFDVLGFFPIFM
jgi:Zn-dependent M28 family amino/carboxypeptidase